jgi:protein kinase C substrate 80K-H
LPLRHSTVFRLHEYLPEPLVPYIDSFVDSFLDILLKTNIITGVKRGKQSSAGGDTESATVTAARQAKNEASHTLRKLTTSLDQKLKQVQADPAKYGNELEWKALEGKCIEKNMGEYTYEYCFFGHTTQKPNKGGSNVRLGNFDRFQPLDESVTHDGERKEEFYKRQIYQRGQRCWNGPERSTIVDVQCAMENAVLDVFEVSTKSWEDTSVSFY